MLTRTEGGQHGEQHIQQKLANSIEWTPSLPIASAIFQANILSQGKVYAVADWLPDCNRDNFEVWCGHGGNDVKKVLARWVWDFVRVSPEHVCLIDEQQSEANDVSWRSDMLPSFADTVRFSNGSIFYQLSSANITREAVSELVQATYWFNFCCAFVMDSDQILRDQPGGAEVSKESLVKAGSRTHRLVTDAYDLEGILVWTRDTDFERATLDNLT